MKNSVALVLTAITLSLTSCSIVIDTQPPSRVKATFVNYDNSVLYVASVEYGGTAVYQGDTPSRPTQSESHHYVFSGWDLSLKELKVDTTFIAQYEEVVNTYTVEFRNYDDTLLQAVEVTHGATASYTAEQPLRPNTPQYSYVFNGWDKPLTNITRPDVIHAQYVETLNQYTVTFKNDDGAILGSCTVDYGASASYPGATPTKQASESHHFEFVGWDISLESITENCVATAQYRSEINTYVVRFLNYDGTELGVDTVEYDGTASYRGDKPTKPKTPQYSYEFEGWGSSLEHIKADQDIVAMFTEKVNQYTVTFYNDDDTVLWKSIVDYGGDATYEGVDPSKDATAKYAYTFVGWDGSLENIVEDCDRHAIYASAIREYTVTFKNDDGSILSEETVQYGDDAFYRGEEPKKTKTPQYSYTFIGWDGSLENIVSDVTVTALYKETVNQYNVTFQNYDGTILYVDTVDYGSDATYRGEEPHREKTPQYSYSFTGWDGSLESITDDRVVVAKYIETTNSYTVTFVDEDGTLLGEDTVLYGETAIYKGSIPTKERTQQYSYTFTGWDISLENISSDCVAKAKYQATINQYTVTFKDYDGTILCVVSVDYGSDASYAGKPFARSATKEYSYAFTGWDISLNNVTEDRIAIAQYQATKNRYTVTFQNYDGTILDTCTVDYGSNATYHGPDPIKPSTQQYSFSFAGWSIGLGNITDDCVATAQYNSTLNQYTVTFQNYDGTVLGTSTVDYGSDAVYKGGIPSKPANQEHSYVFVGWDKPLAKVTENLIVTAQFETIVNQYTVTFKNYDGTVLGTSTVDYGTSATYDGQTPTRPADVQYSYSFNGWNIDLTSITENCVAVANFALITNKYTVTFRNYDGTILGTSTVDYGTDAKYDGEAPEKPQTQQYSYSFSGWDISLENITSDRVATAQFNATVNQYTVIFKNYDGTILGTSTVDYGSSASYSGMVPTKEPTVKYSYIFNGWDAQISSITEDCVRIATFREQINKYTVTFKNYDGTILGTSTVEYGNTASYSGITPTKAKTQQYSFAFAGWDISLENIIGDRVAIAQYDSIVNQYTVTFKNYDGSILGTSTVDYGTAAFYEGQTPTKAASAQYSYIFVGWDKGLDYVTENYSVIAQYAPVTNQYTVTFKNYDGSILGTSTVDYGSNATYSGYTPYKPSSEQYNYTFTGWDGSLDNVTSDRTVFAQYSNSLRSYIATFKNYDGTILDSCEVLYGGSAIYSGSTPIREKDIEYTYAFSGWDKSLDNIKGDTVFIAQFDTTINKYTLSIEVNDEAFGTVTGAGEYDCYSGITLKATPKEGYLFNGWYKDADYKARISAEENYFAFISADTKVYAKFWSISEKESWDEMHAVEPSLSQDGTTVTYGLYPQKYVGEKQQMELSSVFGETDGQVYYDGEYYVRRKADINNLINRRFVAWDGSYIIDTNWYWFKAEPISWQVLSVTNGDYLLLSSAILECTYWSWNVNYGSRIGELLSSMSETCFQTGDAHLCTTTVNVDYMLSTTAKLFLLSSEEYRTYDPRSDCKMTEYARLAKPKYLNYYWTADEYDYSNGGVYGGIGAAYNGPGPKSQGTNYGIRPAMVIHI